MKQHLIKPLVLGRPKGIKTHDPEVAQAFGIAVRQLRLTRGISQEALADLSTLARSHIGRIERGELTPMITVVIKLAKGLEMRSGEIMDETEKILKKTRR